MLEVPSSNGPYGVKGVGEMTANSPIPAIVNAIFDATGVRVDHLPVAPGGHPPRAWTSSRPRVREHPAGVAEGAA